MAIIGSALQDTAELADPDRQPSPRVVACAARTDRGAHRTHNEDAVLAAGALLAVADGVGGRLAGEEASTLALDVVRRAVRAQGTDARDELIRALRDANDAVRAAGHTIGRAGMATTIVVALVSDGQLAIAHVGDSRAYLLRDGRLTPLTVDHSLVSALASQGALAADAVRSHPMRSVILRALGLTPEVQPDIVTLAVRADDVLLLCSDGMSDAIEPRELERLVRLETDLDRLVARLAHAALQAGAGDDVSVVVARLG